MKVIQAQIKITATAPDQGNAAFRNDSLHQDHNALSLRCATSNIVKSRSTDTYTYCVRNLEPLKTSPQPTYGLRCKGASHPAQRLNGFTADGHKLVSSRVIAAGLTGYMHAGDPLCSVERRND